MAATSDLPQIPRKYDGRSEKNCSCDDYQHDTDICDIHGKKGRDVNDWERQRDEKAKDDASNWNVSWATKEVEHHIRTFKAGADWARIFTQAEERHKVEGLVKEISSALSEYVLAPGQYPEDDHQSAIEAINKIQAALAAYTEGLPHAEVKAELPHRAGKP